MQEPADDTSLYKILGHPERHQLLRHLMAGQATLTQLGARFGQTPAHIRHHLKVLEDAGLVEFVEARPVQGGPEKYYRSARRALFVQRAILPEIPANKTGIFLGSMDAGVSFLSDYFAGKDFPFVLLPIPLSSLDGLIALRQGLCQMSTCHLFDRESQEYNRSFVRHLFPGQRMALVQIYRREEGLILPPGNPLGVHSLEDLARPGIRFANREPGSGVRVWLDIQLERIGIPSNEVLGYEGAFHSHREVAQEVQSGSADTGIGIAAAARELGLDFLPLYEEPYEIAVPLALVEDRRYSPFFDYLNSGDFRLTIRNLEGYRVPQNAGQIEPVHS